jgi:hypothetical protein
LHRMFASESRKNNSFKYNRSMKRGVHGASLKIENGT